jgi:hypothetical protein
LSGFVDAVMLKLSTAAALTSFIDPPADPTHGRIRQLLGTLYGLPAASVADVLRVAVTETEFQRPLFRPRLLTGTWTRTAPDPGRTDVVYEGREPQPPEWIDLCAELAVTVSLQLDAGTIESIRVTDIEDFETLADFEAKFRYFDLAGFMAGHGITTVEGLKRAYRYLLTEIRLVEPAPVVVGDPANERRLTLNIAVLVRDVVDLAEGLRAARLVRDLAERGVAYRRRTGDVDVLAGMAPVLVVPEAAVTAAGLSDDEIVGFIAGQDVLAIPFTP